jgi:hypothetical protein
MFFNCSRWFLSSNLPADKFLVFPLTKVIKATAQWHAKTTPHENDINPSVLKD